MGTAILTIVYIVQSGAVLWGAIMLTRIDKTLKNIRKGRDQ